MKKVFYTKIQFITLLILILFTGQILFAQQKKGDIIFKMDFENGTDNPKWSSIPSAKWVNEGPEGSTCLLVDVLPEHAMDNNMVYIPVDLTPYHGMVLFFQCLVKAKDVTKPLQPYLGVKYMLHFKSSHEELWRNQNNVFGTFDWKELSFSAVIPDDSVKAEIFLGLQSSSGKVWFDNITISVFRPRPPVPTISQSNHPAFKGHNLPRLRGVMSPNNFKEEDFRTLGLDWNANLIRWQITKTWGDTVTERDLDKYDKWISAKLVDLDKALKACIENRIKLVIDLHSPPGGRDENGNMIMFYNKKYNDYFIKLWAIIASRYKENPAVWGYDLVNEPQQDKPSPDGMDYLETQTRAAKAIRNVDSLTAIIIESDRYDSPESFKYLVPLDVSNIVYQVHMYLPSQFTHQGVSDTTKGVVYPGIIAGKKYDKDALRDVLKPVRDFQLTYNVHIYAGEFSAVRWAQGAAQYLSDCIEIFEEYGWDWSYHAFRESQLWNVEYENYPVDRNAYKLSTTNTDRKDVLLSWFAKNKKPKF